MKQRIILEIDHACWAPAYLCDLISVVSPGRCNLYHDYKETLLHQNPRGRTFVIAAPKLWNMLPFEARNYRSIGTFKTIIKTFLFKQAFEINILTNSFFVSHLLFFVFIDHVLYVTFHCIFARLNPFLSAFFP